MNCRGAIAGAGRRRVAGVLCLCAAAVCLVALLQSGAGTVAAEPWQTPEESYASPLELLLSSDESRLYVLCSGTDEVRVLDVVSGRELHAIPVGHQPRGFVFSPDSSRLYVVNSWDDTVSVIDVKTNTVVATWNTGYEPSGIASDRSGKTLFIANRIGNDISVLDATTGEQRDALAAGRGASYLTASADRNRIYATHIYPNPGPHRTAPKSEITVIDAARARIVERVPLPEIAGVFHVALSRDGRLGVAAELHPKNLVPLAHVEHGWGFVDTLTFFGADVGRPVEVPLDELDRYFARPFGLAIAPDKSRIYVSHGGSNVVSILDTRHLLAFIHAHPEPFAEDLSASAHYVVARVPVGKNPRGVTLNRDGSRLFVANRLDDTISIVDTRTNRVVRTFRLRTPQKVSALRRGEQTFYTAQYSFQGQFGCANCHIDSTFDGLQWDLEPDGFGKDIVDNRLLEDLRGTEPFKWNGGNPSIPVECGPRTEMYFWRSQQYDPLTLADLTLYIRHLPLRPNRFRAADGSLTPAQDRGREIFYRAVDKLGQPIPEGNQCVFCHSGPKGTSQKSFDVGTRRSTDNNGQIDTPQLMNIALTAPYLHDGSAQSLEEIWTVYNPHDQHGRTNDLTKDELNDLIEYLRTR
ncbi:MAG TPA: beta-propeller fold lactonase family protein [Acidobacteriaceae bacterium]|nr:beta-propeller fold lactonase family protein [Acidobacteriaceae bacterium]